MKASKAFPLLVYREAVKSWGGPSFWMIPAGGLLWWALSTDPETSPLAWLSIGISIVGLLIFIYTRLARNACVRCYEDHFTIYTPFYPIAISYGRVTMIRPSEFKMIFPLEKEKEIRINIFRSLWTKTAILVDVKSYPLPFWWLKLWVSPYLLNPKGNGLVLLTEEWMTLSRQLGDARSNWADAVRRRRNAQ